MKRTAANLAVILALFALALAVQTATGCYDANSPNLPPCDPKHPDPSAGCFDAAKDAGADG